MPQSGSRDTRIKVLACRQAYTGRNKRGDEFTIYEIEAAKPDGSPIREKLRAFTSLPIGQEIDVTVTPYESEQWGRSFTLHPRGKRTGNFGDQINELTQQIGELQEVVPNLSRRVAELEEAVAKLTRGASEPPPSKPPESEELDRRFGADPPEGDTW